MATKDRQEHGQQEQLSSRNGLLKMQIPNPVDWRVVVVDDDSFGAEENVRKK
jgi:hypothetical protein